MKKDLKGIVTAHKGLNVWEAKHQRVARNSTDNNLKYTSGSWYADKYTVRSYDTNNPICAVVKTDNLEEGKANTKLIAQAPNMLMTLFLCRDYFIDSLKTTGLQSHESEIFRVIELAIKKATK